MPLRICVTLLVLLFLQPHLPAQQLEHHDVLLFSLVKNEEQSWTPTAPRFLSAFNPLGYNNQPAFFSDNELYLTVQFPGDTTQTDIFSLDLLSRALTRITATQGIAEYSPAPVPGGKRFSAVRVEADGAQRLWSFPLDRSDNGKPEFPDINGVGYHCWMSDTLAALFIVGEPHYLMLADTRGNKVRKIAFNIGRCLVRRPDGKLAFVQKATEQTWFIKEYDPKQQLSVIVTQTLQGSEDFVVLPDGSYLAGSGARLYHFRPAERAEWRLIADLSKYGVKKISRLAASPGGKLAVVVQ